METKKITCSCGQVTHLEKKDGDGWRYAEYPHGSNAPATGCFNCHGPLGLPGEVSAAPAAVAPAPAPVEPTYLVVTPKSINAMKTGELEALAAAQAVDLTQAKNNDDRKALLIDALFADDPEDTE